MLFSKLAFSFVAFSAISPAASSPEEPDQTIGDIFGDPKIFDPYHSVTVDKKDCNYEATLRLNVRDAGLPFPSNRGVECVPPAGLVGPCNGKSCIFDQRSVYRFNAHFEKVTGFNHVGLDWSPCGHPPDFFKRSHMNLHMYRVTPEERLAATCVMSSNRITCDGLDKQTEQNGRKFYVWGTGSDGEVANIPTFATGVGSAVPGEGAHAYDLVSADASTDTWVDPFLITGLYDGTIQFWEPMVPFEFVSGETENHFEQAVEYKSQTIRELPFEWSMTYDPEDGYTTVIMKGQAKECEGEGV